MLLTLTSKALCCFSMSSPLMASSFHKDVRPHPNAPFKGTQSQLRMDMGCVKFKLNPTRTRPDCHVLYSIPDMTNDKSCGLRYQNLIHEGMGRVVLLSVVDMFLLYEKLICIVQDLKLQNMGKSYYITYANEVWCRKAYSVIYKLR